MLEHHPCMLRFGTRGGQGTPFLLMEKMGSLSLSLSTQAGRAGGLQAGRSYERAQGNPCSHACWWIWENGASCTSRCTRGCAPARGGCAAAFQPLCNSLMYHLQDG